MKIVYLFAIILIVYLAVLYIRFNYVLSHAHLPKVTQIERKFGIGSAMRYIAAGDSTAVGEGASSVEKTYPYKVAEYLGTKHTVEYKNVAVGGAKTQDIIDHELTAIIAYNPDIITISIGANDVTHLRSNSSISENYKTIVNELTAKHCRYSESQLGIFTASVLSKLA
jgi:lysophospholipase L1-like esterase